MSNSNGGSDRLGFKISESVKKTIKDIREIIGKQHSDEDIYSVLSDCSMDPNETAQKLLYLDTFQEVKKKSNRRKVTPSTQGRGQSGNRGFNSRNSHLKPRENGVNHMKERGNNSSFRGGQKKNNGVSSVITAASGAPVGSSNFPNGAASPRHGSNMTASAVNQIDDKTKSSNPDHLPPTSSPDPILAPSNVWNRGSEVIIKREVESGRKAAEQNHGNKLVNGDLGVDLSENEQLLSRNVNPVRKEKDPKPIAFENYSVADSVELSSLSAHIDSLNISSSDNAVCHAEETPVPVKESSPEDAKKAKTCTQLLPQSTLPNGHVIFPDHLKLPEAIKNGFTFGSFNNNGCDTPTAAAEKNETARETLFSDQNMLLSVQVNNSDLSISPRNKENSELAANEMSDANVNQLNQESTLLPDAKENSVVSVAPNYGSEIKPPAQSNQIVQLEVQETKAQNASSPSSVVGDNLTTSSQTPTVQNPVAASPHPLLFRPPYHPNFLPYAHYYSPYFMPQFHQFLNPNGLPQQPSTGAYLPQPAAASGVKFPLPQFKPGTNGVNPSVYGSYGLPSAGLNSGPALTLGGNTNDEDISASQLKESEVYTTGAMNEVPAWIPSGHEISGLQLNSYYHLPPQGQHPGFSHAPTSHSPFPGIYPSLQTMNVPSATNPIMQQSQSMSVETVGPPPAPAAFHQPQISQVSWSANY